MIESEIYKDCKYSPEINKSFNIQSRYQNIQKIKPEEDNSKARISVNKKDLEENKKKVSDFLQRMEYENKLRENKKKEAELELKQAREKEVEELKKLASKIFTSNYEKQYGKSIEYPHQKNLNGKPSKENYELVLDDSICLNFKLDN